VSAARLVTIENQHKNCAILYWMGTFYYLFFTIVGLLLFGLPRLVSVASTPVAAAYILTIAYLLGHLRTPDHRLPTLFSTSIACTEGQTDGTRS